METNTRRAITDKLNKYCICSNSEDDFIEVTEWTNGEGMDVTINSNHNERSFSLTRGELDAVNYLINTLDYRTQE